jgi:hypothetical protein
MRFLNIRSLFLFDGFVFTVVGALVLFFPSASAAALPPEAGATPHMLETRRLLACAYMAVGFFLLAFGRAAVPTALLKLACRLRAASLLLLVSTNLIQIQSGNWKPQSLWVYVCAFSAMAACYFISAWRMPAQASQPAVGTTV